MFKKEQLLQITKALNYAINNLQKDLYESGNYLSVFEKEDKYEQIKAYQNILTKINEMVINKEKSIV